MSDAIKLIRKYGFDFDASNLAAWTEEKADEVAVRQVTEARTLDLINMFTDVKGSEKKPIIESDVTWQEGGTCATTPSGDDVIDQFDVTNYKVRIEKTYCVEKLADFFTRQVMTAGAVAENENLPFEDILVNDFLKRHNLELDKAIWQGDRNLSGSTNLKFFDGFATQFDASNAVIDANADLAYTSFSNSNIYAALEEVYRKTAETNYSLVMNENFTIFVNAKLFTYLKANYASKNFFHLTPDGGARTTLDLFGYQVAIEYVPGLDGKDAIYAGDRTKMYFVTDLMNDVSSFKIWYSEDDDAIKLRAKFRGGTAVPFFNEFTKFVLVGSSS